MPIKLIAINASGMGSGTGAVAVFDAESVRSIAPGFLIVFASFGVNR